MPALVAGIHVFEHLRNEDVDGRDKPGHDSNTSRRNIRELRMRAEIIRNEAAAGDDCLAVGANDL